MIGAMLNVGSSIRKNHPPKKPHAGCRKTHQTVRPRSRTMGTSGVRISAGGSSDRPAIVGALSLRPQGQSQVVQHHARLRPRVFQR